MIPCSICTEEHLREDMIHLSIYVVGSEGIMVCFECRMILTEYVRLLKRVVAQSKMLGVKLAKCKLPHIEPYKSY